jgi:hypothetical protein
MTDKWMTDRWMTDRYMTDRWTDGWMDGGIYKLDTNLPALWIYNSKSSLRYEMSATDLVVGQLFVTRFRDDKPFSRKIRKGGQNKLVG